MTPSTIAQRIVRAKSKIREARIPYEVPGRTQLADGLESVLRVIYLVFNEGYLASSGGTLTRHDLSAEAIRLGRLLVELLPEPDVVGLLALMLLHDARRAARTSESGELVLLDQQDRKLWNRDQIADAPNSSNAHCRRMGSVPTRFRRRSPHCMRKPQAPKPPTGSRSLHSTT